MNKYDERNIMFARMNYAEGSEIYNDYYGRNPHMKETDDSLRALPQMGQEGSVMYDKIRSIRNYPTEEENICFLLQV